MAERLHDLWGAWTGGSLPSWLVVVILTMAALTWLAGTVLTSREAGQRHANAFGWAVLVALVPLGILCLALLLPGSFPWFALGAGCAAGLGALTARWTLIRSEMSCDRGHKLAPSWSHCPQCPPARAAAPARGAFRGAAPALMGAMTGQALVPPAYTPGVRHAEPPAKAMIRLIAQTPGVSDHVVTERGALLGRNPAADIPIDDQAASWDHARIVDRGGSPAVLDLGSSNGTYVNEERVETSLLIAGDRLRVGETVFKVVS